MTQAFTLPIRSRKRGRCKLRSRSRAQSFQIGALTFWWSTICSENRFPLFRIMLYDCGGVKPEAL